MILFPFIRPLVMPDSGSKKIILENNNPIKLIGIIGKYIFGKHSQREWLLKEG
jgi:hypothetical protein